MAFRGFQRSVGAAFPVAGDYILLPRDLAYNPHGRRAAHQHHHYVYQQRALGTHPPPPPPQRGDGGPGFPVAGEYIRTTAQQLLPPQSYYYYVYQDFSNNPPPPPQQFDSVRGGVTATASEEGSEVCAICLDDLYCPDQSTNNVGILDCRHIYHCDCNRRWLRVKNFCPIYVASSSS